MKWGISVVSFLKNLKKLFSSAETPPPEAPAKSTDGSGDLEAFVNYVVCALVDTPQSVAVKTVNEEQRTTIQVRCEKCDIGKVIGKNGKTIAAIRALANGAAGRVGKRVNVEILD